MAGNKGKLQHTLRDCEILTIFDKQKGSSRQFIVIEKNELLWRLVALDNRQEAFLKKEEFGDKNFIHSIVQRQILRIWDTSRFKPKQFLANRFIRKTVLGESRLIFLAETLSGQEQLIDNGKFWMFEQYGQPFNFCGYLACPVKFNSGQWTIAVERTRHLKFQAEGMPFNIRVDQQQGLLVFKHPDYLRGWVTISLADYGLKPIVM